MNCTSTPETDWKKRRIALSQPAEVFAVSFLDPTCLIVNESLFALCKGNKLARAQ